MFQFSFKGTLSVTPKTEEFNNLLGLSLQQEHLFVVFTTFPQYTILEKEGGIGSQTLVQIMTFTIHHISNIIEYVLNLIH